VTVICPNAELADALATATFIKGKEKGLAFLNSLKGIEGILINDQDKVFYTKNVVINE
jgi:FAD:protein FMN transferase